jgi:hypothetical protein
MLRAPIGAALALAFVLAGFAPAIAEPIAVRYTEGLTRGFPVLRSLGGEKLAQGELTQVARANDVVESRLVFRFKDGSLYDERVTFSQKDVFTLLSYHIVQQGPSFPEALDGRVDRRTGKYEVRYKGDEDSPEETLKGSFDMPGDVYNGMLSMLMKNMPASTPATVQIIAFTPKPRLVKMLLKPAAEDPMEVNDAAVIATRFLVRPQLGLFASLLVADIPDVKCWIAGGEAPAFLRFEGPLYFMGPIWRIDWS